MQQEVPDIKVTPGEATYLLWLDCSKITADAQKLAAYIRRTTGLYVSEGSQFGQGGECFLRVNIACPRSVLKEGMLLLVTGLASYQE